MSKKYFDFEFLISFENFKILWHSSSPRWTYGYGVLVRPSSCRMKTTRNLSVCRKPFSYPILVTRCSYYNWWGSQFIGPDEMCLSAVKYETGYENQLDFHHVTVSNAEEILLNLAESRKMFSMTVLLKTSTLNWSVSWKRRLLELSNLMS